METLKSILIDLDNDQITKEQAYTLIITLFGHRPIHKPISSGDFRDDDNRETQAEYLGRS